MAGGKTVYASARGRAAASSRAATAVSALGRIVGGILLIRPCPVARAIGGCARPPPGRSASWVDACSFRGSHALLAQPSSSARRFGYLSRHTNTVGDRAVVRNPPLSCLPTATRTQTSCSGVAEGRCSWPTATRQRRRTGSRGTTRSWIQPRHSLAPPALAQGSTFVRVGVLRGRGLPGSSRRLRVPQRRRTHRKERPCDSLLRGAARTGIRNHVLVGK